MKMILGILTTLALALPALAEEVPNTTTVKQGESLMDVSFRIYGTHKRWRDIYAWNKGVIPNPNKLEKGTVLQLKGASAPAAEPVAAAQAPAPKPEAQPAPAPERAPAKNADKPVAALPAKTAPSKELPALSEPTPKGQMPKNETAKSTLTGFTEMELPQ